MNIDGMQNWIQNQFDLLQNSKGNRRKMEGKTKKRKQRNTKFKLKYSIVKHINGIQNYIDLKLYVLI